MTCVSQENLDVSISDPWQEKAGVSGRLPSAFIQRRRLTGRKVTERSEGPRGNASSARWRSPVGSASPSARLRQPSVIQECATTHQADAGGRPDGLTARETERPERTAQPKLPRWGRGHARQRDDRGDSTMLTSVTMESLPVHFFLLLLLLRHCVVISEED